MAVHCSSVRCIVCSLAPPATEEVRFPSKPCVLCDRLCIGCVCVCACAGACLCMIQLCFIRMCVVCVLLRGVNSETYWVGVGKRMAEKLLERKQTVIATDINLAQVCPHTHMHIHHTRPKQPRFPLTVMNDNCCSYKRTQQSGKSGSHCNLSNCLCTNSMSPNSSSTNSCTPNCCNR